MSSASTSDRIIESEEKQPLLSWTPNKSTTRSLHVRFLFSIGFILILVRGCESMTSVTLKQYVYYWCKLNVNSTSASKVGVTIDVSNSSESCDKNSSNNNENEAQKLASEWELYYNILYSFLVFFSVSIFGTVSDYTGRKPFFCLAIAGYALKSATISVVIYFEAHISYILIGYAIDGMCGSTYAISVYSFISMADITTDTKKRVLGIAVIETLIGCGSLTTEFGNGYFIQLYGYFYPLLTSTAGLCLSLFIAVVFFVETNSRSSPRPTTNVPPTDQLCRSSVPSCSVLFRNYVGFYIGSETKDKGTFWLCLVVFCLLEIASQGRSDPLTLYQLGSPFCWSSEVIGWYNASLIAVSFLVGCMLLRPLQFCFSTNVIACMGIVSRIAYNVVTGMVTTTPWLFAAIGFGVLMMLPKSILRGTASTTAKRNVQGAMFAGLESSELVCKLVSNPVSLTIYSNTLSTMKGLVFLGLAGIDVLALVLMVYLTHVLNSKRQEKQIVINETGNETGVNAEQ